MNHPGSVRETYGAALRLGEATPEPDDLVVHVGSQSSETGDRSYAHPAIDAGQALAPPDQLRFDLDRALDRFDLDDAWDAVQYESRYRAFLESDLEAQTGLARLRRHLGTGGTVWFVCPGNTPDERRHRAVLVDVLGERTRYDGGSVDD